MCIRDREITVASDEANNLRTIRLTCSHAEGLHASSKDKGKEILDFEVVNDNGEVLDVYKRQTARRPGKSGSSLPRRLITARWQPN